jgi:hypothetical protein
MTATPPPSSAARPPSPSRPATRPAWWRRPGVLVAGAVLAIVAVAVVTDLPHSSSIAQQAADESTVMGEINTDLSPCAFAASESFSIYSDLTHGTVTASQKVSVPGLLQDDQSACSFTDSSIYDLSNIEVPGSAAGREIGDLVITVTEWASSDAVAAIQQIATLAGDPTDTKALAALSSAERLLASDRAKALAELKAADKLLGNAHLPAPSLPALPSPA